MNVEHLAPEPKAVRPSTMIITRHKGYRAHRGVTFARPAGLDLRATVYDPDNPVRNRPAVVVIHGGAWLFGSPYQQAWWCRAFARAGMVVMTPEYRLMPRFAYPHCVHDCKAAVRWLRINAARYHVDSDRIAVFGASAGGQLAAIVAATENVARFEGAENPGVSSRVCAAAILYGAVAPEAYHDFPRPGLRGWITRQFFRDFCGREWARGCNDTYGPASVVPYIHPKCPPTVLVHGTGDSVVPCDQADRMLRALRIAGVPSEIIRAHNRFHGYDYLFHRERQSAFDKMLAFLINHGMTPNTQEQKSPGAITAPGLKPID